MRGGKSRGGTREDRQFQCKHVNQSTAQHLGRETAPTARILLNECEKEDGKDLGSAAEAGGRMGESGEHFGVKSVHQLWATARGERSERTWRIGRGVEEQCIKGLLHPRRGPGGRSPLGTLTASSCSCSTPRDRSCRQTGKLLETHTQQSHSEMEGETHLHTNIHMHTDTYGHRNTRTH